MRMSLERLEEFWMRLEGTRLPWRRTLAVRLSVMLYSVDGSKWKEIMGRQQCNEKKQEMPFKEFVADTVMQNWDDEYHLHKNPIEKRTSKKAQQRERVKGRKPEYAKEREQFEVDIEEPDLEIRALQKEVLLDPKEVAWADRDSMHKLLVEWYTDLAQMKALCTTVCERDLWVCYFKHKRNIFEALAEHMAEHSSDDEVSRPSDLKAPGQSWQQVLGDDRKLRSGAMHSCLNA
jgi:hypothetical protein